MKSVYRCWTSTSHSR